MEIALTEKESPLSAKKNFNTYNPPYIFRRCLLAGAFAIVALGPSILSAAKSLRHHGARTQIG